MQVLPHLAERGHKYMLSTGSVMGVAVAYRSAITFVHMKTLIRFFEVTALEDAILVAHDWGG